jgi:hypothetical protein
MSVLLRPNSFGVWRGNGTPDAHGWATDGVLQLLADEAGNLQRKPQPVSEHAATDRDRGPAAPYVYGTAVGYLDPDTAAQAGDILIEGGTAWRVASCSLILSPVGGYASCVEADLFQVELHTTGGQPFVRLFDKEPGRVTS